MWILTKICQELLRDVKKWQNGCQSNYVAEKFGLRNELVLKY